MMMLTGLLAIYLDLLADPVETTSGGATTRVDWVAPSTCPTLEEFEQLVLDRLRPTHRPHLHQISIKVAMQPNGKLKVLGSLISATQFERPIPIEFIDVPNCPEAVDAIILAIKTFTGPSSKSKVKWNFSFPAAAGFDSGRLDDSQGQASLRVGSAFQIPHLRLESALYYQGMEQRRNPNSVVNSQLAFASALACYPWKGGKFSLHVCTGPEIGLWHYWGEGTTLIKTPKTSLWLTETIGLRAWWKRQRNFAFGISLEGWMAIRKHGGIQIAGIENAPPIQVERFGFRSQLLFEWDPVSRKRSKDTNERESRSYRARRFPSARRIESN